MRSDSDETFVVEHTALVRGMAAKVRAELNLDVELEDLVNYGFTGLLEARDRFDAERGVPFTAFAHYRIRGAIFDGVRKMARVSRRTQERIRYEKAQDEASQSMAIAGTCGTEDLFDEVVNRYAAAAMADVIASLAMSEEPAPSPEEATLSQFERARVRRAFATLPDREQRVLRTLYYEGRVLDDVSAELECSRASASRIHTRALEILRRALE